ncbi:MAG: hypothetical protein ACYCZR_00070 [Burkholderiales bacterium]
MSAGINAIAAAAGAVPHVRMIDVVFRNPDVDTVTVPETVWPLGGLVALRATAAVVEVVSSDAADAAAGTGARTVRIDGLDADYVEVSETLTLNGTTPVVGAVEFLRINFATVITAGTGKVNAGNITLRDSGAGTTRSYIGAGRGRAEVGVFTVPAGHKVVATDWVVSSQLSTGQTGADFEFWATKNGVRSISWALTGTGVSSVYPTVPHPFEEKTDIEVIVSRVAANDTLVTLHGRGLLIGPNADL